MGFGRGWLALQGIFSRYQLVKKFADICFERKIDVCAVTSEYFEIPKRLHDGHGCSIS